MKAMCERNHVVALLDLARQLQGRLDGVGARRAGALQLILPATRRKQHAIDSLQAVLLSAGGNVQHVHDTAGFTVSRKPLLETGVFVALIQGARAADELHLYDISYVNGRAAP